LKFRNALIATDVKDEEELYNIIEHIHRESSHRGVCENYEELKNKYFYPNLKKFINRISNNCHICCENKYERNPFKKYFNLTVISNRPNEIVHLDIFQVSKTNFLTTIDRFIKLATVHKLSDKNMITVRQRLNERKPYLRKPATLMV